MESRLNFESVYSLSYPKLITFIIVVISFLPVNLATFLIPIILIFFLFFTKKSIPLIFYRFIIFSFFLLFLNVSFNFFFNKYYIFFNSLASLATYGSILTFFCPFYFEIDDEFLNWSIKFLIYFSLFQSIICLYQFFIKYKGSNYDAAVGTLGISGQHELSMKIILPCLLAFSIYLAEKKLRYLIFGIVLLISYIISFFNASSLILCLTFLIILIIFFFDFRTVLFVKKKKIFIFLTVVLVLFLFIFLAFFSDYIKSTYLYSSGRIAINKVINPESHKQGIKVDGYYNTFRFLWRESFFNPIIGVGLGNYSGRAALYLSGEYSKFAEKILPISRSEYTEKYILSLWNRELFENIPYMGSVLNHPWASIQSICGEAGIFGLIMFFLVFFLMLKKISFGIIFFKRKSISYIYFAFFIYIIYIFLMLFIDNYLEFPRVIMPLYFYLGILWVYIKRKKIYYNHK